MSDRDLRRELIHIGELMHRHSYTVGLDGNISARCADGRLLVTRSGCHKGLLTTADLLIVDNAGAVIEGTGNATSEMPLHLACYAARTDVGAVIHAHPPYAVAATLAGISLMEPVLPEAVIALDGVPTLPYSRTGTGALAAQVEGAIASFPGVLLERHGAVAVGSNLLDAFCNLETIEHTARILLLAHSAGSPAAIAGDEVAALRAVGRTRRRV